MRALATTENNSVTFIDVPEPAPASDEALIAVTAATIARGDLSASRFAPVGAVLGLELVGTVTRAAADGSGPKEGTRVLAYSHRRRGAWAQVAAVDTSLIAPVPEALDDTKAAALPTAAWPRSRACAPAGPCSARGCS